MLVTLGEELGSIAIERHGVERPARLEDKGVRRGPGGGEDGGINDAVESLDASFADTQHEWGGASAGFAAHKTRLVRGADDTHGNDGAKVQDQYADDKALGSSGDVSSRGFHLSTTEDEHLRGEGELRKANVSIRKH